MNTDKSFSIVLIGMPGVGKSTIGAALAAELKKQFIDTDDLLKVHLKQPIQKYLNEFGYQRLRKEEAQCVLECKFYNHVIATGGSVVYSEEAMLHLQKNGAIVYLRSPLNTLNAQINNFDTRGIASPKGMSLEEIFKERKALYEKYSHFTVDVDSSNLSTNIDVIKARFDKN